MLTRRPGLGYDIFFESCHFLVEFWSFWRYNVLFFQSIVTVGAAIGGLLGGWMVEKIGRKLSLMFCSLPFVFGFTIIIAAQNVWMLYVGRWLTGLASGVTSLVVPVRDTAFTVGPLCSVLQDCCFCLKISHLYQQDFLAFFNNCNIWDWKRKHLWKKT